MIKITLLLCCLAAFAAGACVQSFVESFDGLEFDDSGTQTGTLNYCATLKAAADLSGLCCKVDSINGIGDKVTALQTALESAAQTRDEAILAARKAIVDSTSSLVDFATAYAAATTNLATYVSNSVTNAQDVLDAVTQIIEWYATVITNYNTLYDGFDTYRTNRATCLNALIGYQAATWCWACDSTFDTNGFDGASSISYGTDLTDDIVDKCYDYLSDSASQSVVLSFNPYVSILDDLTAALNTIAEDDQAGVATFNTAFTGVTASTTVPSKVPSGCQDTGCTWLTSTAFPDGVLSNDDIIKGGEDDTRRLLRLLSEGRQLSGTWGPAADESGATIDFSEAPGGLENPNDMSALRVGIISCIVTLAVAFLF